jgi:cytochrome c-type biogenesis protein CcmH
MKVILALLIALAPLAVAAKEAQPTDLDPVAQKRLIDLTSQFRCLVCQNETIADSTADLAADLRREIREQIQAGKTDAQIRDFMTTRYGDFVLYRPPLKATTLLLWFGPALLLLVGIVVLVRVMRGRRQRAEGERPLSDAERSRAAALLAGESERR